MFVTSSKKYRDRVLDAKQQLPLGEEQVARPAKFGNTEKHETASLRPILKPKLQLKAY